MIYCDEIVDFSGRKFNFKKKIDFVEDDIPVIWDKKRFPFEKYLDLKDFSIFFKFKEFHNLKNEFPHEFLRYEKEKSRIDSWIKTFSEMKEEQILRYPLFPHRMASNFLQARADVLARFIEWMENTEAYILFQDYYLQYLSSFDVLRRMEYEILTRDGIEKVELEFAENFRFKSVPDTLNLFHMRKELRNKIIPQSKDEFLYIIDFRQFEFRTFLNIAEVEIDYTSDDLYGDIGKSVGMSGDDIKTQLIAYLYSSYPNEKLEKIVNKTEILDRIEDDTFIWNEIPVYVGNCEENKKLHTIIQTISYFYYLEKLNLILGLIDNKKSKFIFPLHDAIIFSIHKDDLILLEEIPKILESDVYRVKQYIGNNFLEISEI